ncbi:patatin-like phospholipase domain-containing protein 1-like [Platysternon megacephalum]|uniref:Patatin-like phospholipase domain-containing protein 1-like n=1 Tax=Platysternon megacephalum TaxID=55544 RepID=A0A4D9E271_9SAUR|nr:patatin-like phospholipase domain-containing protein 1-like [Platysternon megacephalum]
MWGWIAAGTRVPLRGAGQLGAPALGQELSARCGLAARTQEGGPRAEPHLKPGGAAAPWQIPSSQCPPSPHCPEPPPQTYSQTPLPSPVPLRHSPAPCWQERSSSLHDAVSPSASPAPARPERQVLNFF